jgi:hypothetical protein
MHAVCHVPCDVRGGWWRQRSIRPVDSPDLLADRAFDLSIFIHVHLLIDFQMCLRASPCDRRRVWWQVCVLVDYSTGLASRRRIAHTYCWWADSGPTWGGGDVGVYRRSAYPGPSIPATDLFGTVGVRMVA